MKPIQKTTKVVTTLLSIGAVLGISHQLQAYEVGIGTHGWQQAQYDEPGQWDLTATKIQFMSINWAPGTPPEGRLARDLRSAVVALCTTAKMHARQIVVGDADNIPENDFSNLFGGEATYGYKTDAFYTYNGGAGQWKEDEHAYFRQWLDQNGHADVRIQWDERNNRGNTWERPEIEGVGIETDLGSWYDADSDKQGLLRRLTDPTNNFTRNEDVGIHCHMNSGFDVKDYTDGYFRARKLVRDIGRDVMDDSARLAVLRSNYFTILFFNLDYTKELKFLPEVTDKKRKYGENYTGTLLSLIEKKSLFQKQVNGQWPTDIQLRSLAR